MRNSKGQFISSNRNGWGFNLIMPGPLYVLKMLIIFIILYFVFSLWIYVLFQRIVIKETLFKIMESIFIEKFEDDSKTKKSNGFL